MVVVEAVVENEAVKKELFAELDVIVPEGRILASNTSSISITAIGAATKRPELVLGMHFMNPVPMMTLVELVRGQATIQGLVVGKRRQTHENVIARAGQRVTCPVTCQAERADVGRPPSGDGRVAQR